MIYFRNRFLVFEIIILISLIICTSFGPAVETQSNEIVHSSFDKKSNSESEPNLDLKKEIILSYDFSDLQLSKIELNDQIYHMVSFQEGIYPSTPGLPMLAYKQVIIGIPTGASLNYEITHQDLEILEDVNILSCPKQSEPLPGNQIGYGETSYSFTPNDTVFNTDVFYPDPIIDLTDRGFIRDQEIIRIKIYPAQYNPIKAQLKVYRQVEFKIQYQGGNQFRYPEPDEYNVILKRTIINYDSIQELPVRQRTIQNLPQPLTDPIWYKITVNECGIYRLDQSYFQKAGINTAAIDPRTFRLYNSGGGMLSESIGSPIPQKIEIPLYVVGEGDGKFDSGDSISFYGFSYATWVNNVWTKNYYEDKNVYWLTWSGVNGKRMSTKDVTPNGGSTPNSYHQILHLEEDHETSSIGTLDYRDQVIWSFSEVGGAPWNNNVGLVKQAGDRKWADYNISLNASRIAGSKGFMVMFRVSGPNAFYVLFMGDNSNTKLRLYKATPSWKKRGLRAVDHVIVTDENYTINISVLGNNIKCYVNGSKLIDYIDNSNPYLTGNIGLNVDYDSVFDFSNISVIGTNITFVPFKWYENFTNYPLRSNGNPVWTNIQGSLGDFTVRERNNIRVYESTTENIRTTFDLGSWNQSMVAQLRAWVKGMSAWNEGDKKHHGVFYINGHKLLERNWTGHSVWNAKITIPNWMLNVGTNILEFDLPGNDGDNWDYQVLDWVEIDLWRDLKAYKDYLDFNYSASYQGAGKHEFAIGNFTGSDIFGYKIFDYSYTERLINPSISLFNSTYFYNFTDSITSGEDRYIIVQEGSEKEPFKFEPFVSKGLNSSENYYDYLLITHEDLYNESDINNPIVRLANHREQFSGLNVSVITTQQIYDVFSNGLFDPTAIRNFLKFTFDNWTLQPTYVLFAGDTSSAFKVAKYRGTYNVPTHLDDYQGLINGVLASDNWLCCVSGNDAIPDLIPGRLPFASIDEAEILVDKIITYDNMPDTDGWRRNTVFHADDTEVAWESVFKRTCTEQIEYYLEPNGYIATQEAYRDDLTNSQCKNMIKQGVNDGTIMLQYSGHGSPNGWASFNKGDIGALNNKDKYPFVMSMGCSTGTFDTPNSNSFCEEIILAADKGGIASWGPSRTATASIYYYFHSFSNGVFNNGNDVIGSECYNAIVNWADEYHLYIMTFFGDPAMSLGLPSIDFNITTNYRYYERDEEIIVSGILNEPISGLVNITIRDPDMKIWQYNQTTVTNGKFIDRFQIPPDATIGTYHIFAFVWNGSLKWDGLKFIEIEITNPGCNLFIGSENISYSPEQLIGDNEINITVSIQNLGTQATGEYDAWLFLNDPLDGNKLVERKGVSIQRESSSNISFDWLPNDIYAEQNIYVVLDPEHKISEFNENDNKANITIFLQRTPKAYCGNNINSFRNTDILFSGKGSVAYYNELVNYTWDFDDGTKAYILETTHNYTALGKYNVTLTVMDSNNLTNTANITVTIQNKKPVAQFDLSSTIGFVTTQFYFNSTSFDPDGRIVEYAWDFGDGESATEQKVEHFYKVKGILTVNLTVVDNDGGNTTYSRELTIENLGPTAVMEVSNQQIDSGGSITFTGSHSFDPDDGPSIINYTWVINQEQLYTMNFSRVFDLSGIYNVSLKVTDPEGLLDTTYINIVVNNKLPILNLSVSPLEGTVETEFSISAEAIDPDGIITGIYLDIGSEKIINQSFTDAPNNYLFNYDHTFKSNQNKTISAYVIDNHGTRSEVQEITIPIKNLLPVVDIGNDITDAKINRKVSFMPKVSDKDGKIMKYEWDFDGDNIFDLETTEPSATYVYTTTGEFIVTLRVTDNDNGVSEDSINISIGEGRTNEEDEDTKDQDSSSINNTLIMAISFVILAVLILVGFYIFIQRKKQLKDEGQVTDEGLLEGSITGGTAVVDEEKDDSGQNLEEE